MSRPCTTRGFMLLALLIILALGGITLMATVDIWTLQRQREREAQLMYAGEQYRQAIRRYYFSAPTGSPRTLPTSLESLLEDERYPIPVRHLRRLYPDPILGQAEWGEVRVGDRIAGVYSLSEATPIKQAGFPPGYDNFEGRSRYQDWVFTFNGGMQAGAALPSDFGDRTNFPLASSTRSVLGNTK